MKFLIQNAPPGVNIQARFNYYMTGLVLSTLWSLGFLFKYSDAYHRLYSITASGVRYLRGDAMMPDFMEILGGSLLGFPSIALVLMIVIVLNYASFHQGSKSIYLMKRLPDRFELHRRCILLPAVGMAGSLAAAGILLMIYFAVYMLVTPDRCLPPEQWQKIWSVLS